MKHTFNIGNFALAKFVNMMFVNGDGWLQFVTNMVGPQEDTSSSLCIIDTAAVKRMNVKKRDMILEMAQCVKNVLIDGGRNAARLRYLDTCGENGSAY